MIKSLARLQWDRLKSVWFLNYRLTRHPSWFGGTYSTKEVQWLPSLQLPYFS